MGAGFYGIDRIGLVELVAAWRGDCRRDFAIFDSSQRQNANVRALGKRLRWRERFFDAATEFFKLTRATFLDGTGNFAGIPDRFGI